jgi:hypothetical protein
MCQQCRPFGTFVAKRGEGETRGLSRIEQKPEPDSVRHDGQAMEKPRFGKIQRQWGLHSSDSGTIATYLEEGGEPCCTLLDTAA